MKSTKTLMTMADLFFLFWLPLFSNFSTLWINILLLLLYYKNTDENNLS